VGRSARDNDELTMRHSKGSDLWLHTADAPGSHVVLCLDKGAEADPEEVLDAAHLAVHFSPLKGARRADVHVAARKLVHKPKGAKPGLVTLSGGKVLSVRMQPERLERLLGSGRPSAGGEA
jgi:predicted ribosome quality control (RQC) complex YloA/Tae2 family protein